MEENFGNKASWKHPANVIKILGLLLLAVVVLAAIFRERFVTPPIWQVSAIGRAEIAYMPDVAKVNIGVQVDKVYSADAALKRLDETMTKVISAIEKLGIDKKDIQTQNYSLYPQYDYLENSSVLAGYNANQQLTVTIKDLSEENDLVSKVISAVTEAGANQVNGVTFESSNIESLKQQARIKAIGDAKKKAADLSVAAGVKLGKVIGWWENFVQSPESSYYGYYDGKGGMGGSSGAVVPSGEYKLIVEMNLSYQVK